MKALLAAIPLALAASALAAPAGAEISERNAEFLAALAGVHVTGDVRIMAARAGNVDLAALAASAAEPSDFAHMGDVWIVEVGSGSCPAGVRGPLARGESVEVHPQMHLYPADAGLVATSGSGTLTDWTAKSVSTYAHGVLIAGASDFYCIELFGIYLFFPFVNGVVVPVA